MLSNQLQQTLQQAPSDLLGTLDNYYQRLQAQLPSETSAWLDDEKFCQQLVACWIASDFFATQCVQQPELISKLYYSHHSQAKPQQPTTFDHIASKEELASVLRSFRQQTMLEIIFRDVNQLATTEKTLQALTQLADSCIINAVKNLEKIFLPTYGKPTDLNGNKQSFIVIAVGKLGGEELNFSSDVDLVFCFNKRGKTQGGQRSIDNQRYFNLLAQGVVQVLNEITEQGFVFRVDLRLRPFGDGGPMVQSYLGMETYYQEQGRDWERYAILKARIINATPQENKKFTELLNRFVYRRYIDYSVMDSLRSIKRLMDQEAQLQYLQDDMKRGSGGIREIEFIIQSLQLIHAGKNPALQKRNLLQSLALLRENDLIEVDVADKLKQTYLFLRKVENRLQMFADQQTQALPVDPAIQQRIIISLEFSCWKDFLQKLNSTREFVSDQFRQLKTPRYQTYFQDKDLTEKLEKFNLIWVGKCDQNQAEEIFSSYGVEKKSELYLAIEKFRQQCALRHLSAKAKQRLQQLMSLLMCQLVKISDADKLLGKISALLDSVLKRSAYLVLLIENPKALQYLLELCHASEWVTRELTKFPMLLDELLDARHLFARKNFNQLKDELQQRCLLIPEADAEQQLEALHQFKHSHVLRVACMQILEPDSANQVSCQLSDIALCILQQVKMIALQKIIDRYGQPAKQQDFSFAIIVYGTLGSDDMSYSSDLDLIFLYSGDAQQLTIGPRPITLNKLASKLAQQIMHLLNIATLSGNLYDLDIRLRPSGETGLLVSHIDAFADYQKNKAWIWEHQALVRARAVSGDQAIVQRFEQIRSEILLTSRDQSELKQAINQMREKMRGHQASTAQLAVDVRQLPGGLIDLEFILQYAILNYSFMHPELSAVTNPEKIINLLIKLEKLTEAQGIQLQHAYHLYKVVIHQSALQGTRACSEDKNLQTKREHVLHLWRKWLQ